MRKLHFIPTVLLLAFACVSCANLNPGKGKKINENIRVTFVMEGSSNKSENSIARMATSHSDIELSEVETWAVKFKNASFEKNFTFENTTVGEIKVPEGTYTVTATGTFEEPDEKYSEENPTGTLIGAIADFVVNSETDSIEIPVSYSQSSTGAVVFEWIFEESPISSDFTATLTPVSTGTTYYASTDANVNTDNCSLEVNTEYKIITATFGSAENKIVNSGYYNITLTEKLENGTKNVIFEDNLVKVVDDETSLGTMYSYEKGVSGVNVKVTLIKPEATVQIKTASIIDTELQATLKTESDGPVTGTWKLDDAEIEMEYDEETKIYSCTLPASFDVGTLHQLEFITTDSEGKKRSDTVTILAIDSIVEVDNAESLLNALATGKRFIDLAGNLTVTLTSDVIWGKRGYKTTINGCGDYNITIEDSADYSITMQNIDFVNGSADNGGMLNLSSIKNVTIKDCSFTNCKGNANSGSGGSIYAASITENFSITNCNFICTGCDFDNRTIAYGGFLCTESTCIAPNISQSNFNGGFAKYGGIMYLESGATITDCSITNTGSSENKGALYIQAMEGTNLTVSITGTTFSNYNNRYSYEYGKGIYADSNGGTLTVNLTIPDSDELRTEYNVYNKDSNHIVINFIDPTE